MQPFSLLITKAVGHFTSSLLIKSKIIGAENLSSYLSSNQPNSVFNNNQQNPEPVTSEQRNYYILENDRVSHYSLLQREAKKQHLSVFPHQVYSLESSSGLTLYETLQDLSATQLSNPNITVNLYPIAIFHGRLPSKERKWIKLFYTESWQKTGIVRHALQLLFNGRQTLIHIGKPLQLKNISEPHIHPQKTAHKALRTLQTHFQQIRSSVIGPDLSHRRTLISLILKDPEVQKSIDQQAQDNGTHRQKIERHCQTMLNDIAADFSPATTRLLDIFFNLLWKKLYATIQVNHIAPVQMLAKTHQLIYLPCHRSHMDYLLLSWALYRHGLMLPHVAAGDNLNIPIIGPLLKRAGAIFMRRKFNGDKLYQTLYKTYLKHMSHRGHSLEYFIEGGRSRTGRLLPPKTGLLSMSIDTFLQNPNHPVAFVPVWISYDRLIESHSYQRELSGQAKKKETLGHIFRSIKILREYYGHAQLSFGQPISLAKSTDPTLSLETNVSRISLDLMRGINNAANVNASSILATCILGSSTPCKAKDLEEKAIELQQLFTVLYADKNTIVAGSPDEWIQGADKMNLLQQSIDTVTISIQQKQELSFYRNNTQHLLILPGLYLLLSHRLHNAKAHNINHVIRTLYPFLQAEFFLPYPAEKLTTELKNIREQLIQQKLLKNDNGLFSTCLEHPLTSILIMTAEPVMLRYYSIIRSLHRFNEISYEDISNTYIQITSRIHQEYGYHSPEYSDKHVLSAFIKQMKKMGLISFVKGRLSLNFNTDQLFKESQKILSSQLIELIETELGNSKK